MKKSLGFYQIRLSLDIISFVKIIREQAVPIAITIATFLAISGAFILFTNLLNLLPFPDKILIFFRPQDILLGMTIYLKVSVDFAIFMGNLMKTNPGWKKRVSIELGTSLGNAIGTIIILTIWIFFRHIEILLALMIAISSFVLLRMAEEGIKDFIDVQEKHMLSRPLKRINSILSFVNNLTHPLLDKILPEGKLLGKNAMPFAKLLVFSFTVPFILGLDDFAGYIPLFSIVNVVSFSIGVFLAHMILTTSLFISPRRTTQVVEKPIIIILGSTAFIGIALYGFYEVLKIIL